MTFTDYEFEEILDTAATIHNMAYDADFQEGIVQLLVSLLLPDVEDTQASLLISRALKGS